MTAAAGLTGTAILIKKNTVGTIIRPYVISIHGHSGPTYDKTETERESARERGREREKERERERERERESERGEGER